MSASSNTMLVAALNLRSSSKACPVEIMDKLARYPFFNKETRTSGGRTMIPPPAPSSTTPSRFTNVGRDSRSPYGDSRSSYNRGDSRTPYNGRDSRTPYGSRTDSHTPYSSREDSRTPYSSRGDSHTPYNESRPVKTSSTVSDDGFETAAPRKTGRAAAMPVAATVAKPVKGVAKANIFDLLDNDTDETDEMPASSPTSSIPASSPSAGAGASSSTSDSALYRVPSASPTTFRMRSSTSDDSAYSPRPISSPTSVTSAVSVITPRYRAITTETTEKTTVKKFSSAALRENADVKDRMFSRIRGIINRIDDTTYETNKALLQQMLDNDDTEFLDDMLKHIITMASSATGYCHTYVRLLHELADEFKHIRTPLTVILSDYMNIFNDVDIDRRPDPDTPAYTAFIESQERKRSRRGYSKFIAELLLVGEVNVNEFFTLINNIITSIQNTINNPDKSLECEEYIECLLTMCSTARIILRNRDIRALNSQILALEEQCETKSRVKISSKAIYALNDLGDLVRANWIG